jgi:hypothetical protein
LLLGELDGNHFGSLSSSEPFLTLKLRINNEWISVARNNNSCVFERNSIEWETFSHPNGLISSVGKNLKWIDSISDWNALANDVW